jgi:DNA-3-methyladenine glycosylase
MANGQVLRARIVETEAYDESDPGSHTYRGRSERNAVMYGPAGFMYVYFIYGMHHCCNIATGSDGHGEAALIRAVEPLVGEQEMIVRRKGQTAANLTNGPSKLCMALDITKELNGHDLSQIPLRLIMRPALPDTMIIQTTRIGLTKGIATPWRFYIRDNQYVSKV